MKEESDEMLDEYDFTVEDLRRGEIGRYAKRYAEGVNLPGDSQDSPAEPQVTSPVRGVPGKSVLRFAGCMSPEDAAEMQRVIEEDCERIDPSSE